VSGGPGDGRARATASLLALGALWGGLNLWLPEAAVTRNDVDSSWRLALNQMRGGPLVWGRDVVFTYGPLGWLLRPLGLGDNYDLSALAFLGVHLLLIVLILRAGWSGRGSLPALVALTVAQLAAGAARLDSDPRLMIALAALGATAVLEARAGWRAGLALLLGATAAATLGLKFSLALGGFALVALVALVLWRLGDRRTAVATVGAALVSWLAIGIACFPDGTAWWRWLRLSVEITTGFDEAMALPGRALDFALGAATAVAAAVLLAIAARARELPARLAPLAFLAPLLIEYRHCLVRPTQRIGLFVATAALCAGWIAATTREVRPRRAAIVVALGLSTIAFAQAAAAQTTGSVAGDAVTVARARAGWTWLLSPAARARVSAELDRQLADLRRDLALPESWRATLSAPGGSVMVLPQQLVYCDAYGLPCVYPRTLQLYQAYTPELDAWVRDGLREARPNHLLVGFHDIADRYPLWSAPLTWREILDAYTSEDVDPGHGLILLRRRPTPIAPAATDARALSATESPWQVPSASATLRLAVRENWSERLRRIFLNSSPYHLQVEFTDGAVRDYRAVPAQLAAGIRLQPLPRDAVEFARLVAGSLAPSTRTVRIEAATRRHFDLLGAWIDESR
jgi:hypothetical protein